jgi:hypothetical protein
MPAKAAGEGRTSHGEFGPAEVGRVGVRASMSWRMGRRRASMMGRRHTPERLSKLLSPVSLG